MYMYPASYLWGTLFIDRGNRDAAQAQLNKESESINTKQYKLMLFPEGTRNQSATLKPFKKGPFHIAIHSQSSVQPVLVSRYLFLDGHKKVFGRGKYDIIVSV